MAKSLIDKLFFVPRVETEVYVDFGCADGTMIGFMASNFPGVFVGYDSSPEMLEIAYKKFGHRPNLTFTDDWEEVLDIIQEKTATLILSSVIHEIYTYSHPLDIEGFWRKVFSTGFEHIVIRDMTISQKNVNKIIDLETVSNVRRNVEQKRFLKEFESRWGEITSGINHLHYLLKYHYHENWERELHENYLPITTEDLLEKIPTSYVIEYMSDYILPFLSSTVRKDFGTTVPFSSHVKMILTHR
jgi:hypothetical protein